MKKGMGTHRVAIEWLEVEVLVSDAHVAWVGHQRSDHLRLTLHVRSFWHTLETKEHRIRNISADSWKWQRTVKKTWMWRPVRMTRQNLIFFWYLFLSNEVLANLDCKIAAIWKTRHHGPVMPILYTQVVLTGSFMCFVLELTMAVWSPSLSRQDALCNWKQTKKVQLDILFDQCLNATNYLELTVSDSSHFHILANTHSIKDQRSTVYRNTIVRHVVKLHTWSKVCTTSSVFLDMSSWKRKSWSFCKKAKRIISKVCVHRTY